MIRSAAKNFHDVAVVTSPSDYDGIADEMARSGGSLSSETKWRLAQKAFATTAAYDSAIAGACGSIIQATEAQRIHHGDGARTHRKDVAQDAADSGGRALVRLDRGGVVVALDAHRDGEAVTDVDDAGALTGADEHPRRLGREPAQMHL